MAALLLLGALLLFAHLGDRALWDDESQTAVLGRQTLKFGLPKFMNGDNVATDRADLSDYNDKKETRQEYSLTPRELWRWTGVRFDGASYLGEITHTITDPEKEMANYIKKNGSAGQTVKAAYGDISLMFYLPQMRIISRWDAGAGIPDYVIKRGPYPLLQSTQFLTAVRDIKYMEEKLPVADVVWSNNPDPLFHLYRMPANKPYLTVFRRVNF